MWQVSKAVQAPSRPYLPAKYPLSAPTALFLLITCKWCENAEGKRAKPSIATYVLPHPLIQKRCNVLLSMYCLCVCATFSIFRSTLTGRGAKRPSDYATMIECGSEKVAQQDFRGEGEVWSGAAACLPLIGNSLSTAINGEQRAKAALRWEKPILSSSDSNINQLLKLKNWNG